MARRPGTGKDYQIAVKIVEAMPVVKEWVVDNLQAALDTMTNVMLSVESKDSTRVAVAKDIVKLHALFYEQQAGEARPVVKDGGSTPLISLKFNGTED